MNGELRVYVSLHMNDVSVKTSILPSATRLLLALHSIILFSNPYPILPKIFLSCTHEKQNQASDWPEVV